PPPAAPGRPAEHVSALTTPSQPAKPIDPIKTGEWHGPQPTPPPIKIVPGWHTAQPGFAAQPTFTTEGRAWKAADVSAKVSSNVALHQRTIEAVSGVPKFQGHIAFDQYIWAGQLPPPTQPTLPTQKVSPFTVDLLDRVDTADVDVARDELLRIFENVWGDENAQSGVFYFVPRGYRLAWDKSIGGSRGLGLRMSYQRLQGQAAESSVRMALTLDAGVDLVQRDVARELLAMQSRQAPGFPFVELRPFALAVPPSVSLKGELEHAYNISGDRIGVVALTDALGQIDVSWTTDTVTTQNMRLALREGLGLAGEIQFSPLNVGGPSPRIPIRIRLDDPETYGTLPWQRTDEMRNHPPFPLRRAGPPAA